MARRAVPPRRSPYPLKPPAEEPPDGCSLPADSMGRPCQAAWVLHRPLPTRSPSALVDDTQRTTGRLVDTVNHLTQRLTRAPCAPSYELVLPSYVGAAVHQALRRLLLQQQASIQVYPSASPREEDWALSLLCCADCQDIPLRNLGFARAQVFFYAH